MKNATNSEKPRTIDSFFSEMMTQFAIIKGNPVPPEEQRKMKSVFVAGFASCYGEFDRIMSKPPGATDEELSARIAYLQDYGRQLQEFALDAVVKLRKKREQQFKAAGDRAAQN